MSDVWPRKTTVVQHGTMAAERRVTTMTSAAVSQQTGLIKFRQFVN